MSGAHSVLSPSKGAMILRCPAALAAGKHVPNESSQYAAEGTAYHAVASTALETDGDCLRWVGRAVAVMPNGRCVADPSHMAGAEYKFTIDEENAAHAQTYVNAIRRLPGAQYFEVRLDTSDVVGVPGQSGTGDAVTLDFDAATIHVDDLKFGRGEVVHAEANEQLLQYGAAALLKFDMVHDWKYVKLGIHQPRLHHYSEHIYTVEQIRAWVEENKPKFRLAHQLYQEPTQLELKHFVPGDKQCRWCPIRGTCKARADGFLAQFPVSPPAQPQAAAPTLTDEALAAARDRVDAIEQWCADIKAEAHTRAVVLGRTLPGWKVVNGRAGNRKWADESKVESVLVSGLQDAAYKPRTLISPADAEKKLKKHSALWDTLVPHITQAEGAKSLVRDDSPKQAVLVQQVEFPVQEAQS